jgi:hypothetical protein
MGESGALFGHEHYQIEFYWTISRTFFFEIDSAFYEPFKLSNTNFVLFDFLIGNQ